MIFSHKILYHIRFYIDGVNRHMKNKKTISIILVFIDTILLVLSILFFHSIFMHILGADFIEYENWFGELDKTIKYRFGAGSAELLFILIRAICFIIAQKKILKEYSEKTSAIFITLHIVIAVLGLIYCLVRLYSCYWQT